MAAAKHGGHAMRFDLDSGAMNGSPPECDIWGTTGTVCPLRTGWLCASRSQVCDPRGHASRVLELASNTSYVLAYGFGGTWRGVLTYRYTTGDTLVITRIKNWDANGKPYRRREAYDERIVMKPGDRLDLADFVLNLVHRALHRRPLLLPLDE